MYTTAAYKETNTTVNTTRTRKVAVPGRKGAIARLIVMGLIAVIALLSSFGTIGQYIPKRGFGIALLEAFGGCGVLMMLGAFFWGFMKWIAVVTPKAFRAANKFWCAWIPLTFFGVYIKAMIWVLIVGVPTCIFGYGFVPVFLLTQHFAENEISFLPAMGMFLGGVALVAVLGFVDICKLKAVSPVQTVKELLAARKAGK